jgi:hypothetical protein
VRAGSRVPPGAGGRSHSLSLTSLVLPLGETERIPRSASLFTSLWVRSLLKPASFDRYFCRYTWLWSRRTSITLSSGVRALRIIW